MKDTQRSLVRSAMARDSNPSTGALRLGRRFGEERDFLRAGVLQDHHRRNDAPVFACADRLHQHRRSGARCKAADARGREHLFVTEVLGVPPTLR